jgi:hypothetical protein
MPIYLQKVKNLDKNFVGILKATEEHSRIRIRIRHQCKDPQIRIRLHCLKGKQINEKSLVYTWKAAPMSRVRLRGSMRSGGKTCTGAGELFTCKSYCNKIKRTNMTEERVFRFFSVSRILLGSSRL